jgi:hypothetical protein
MHQNVEAKDARRKSCTYRSLWHPKEPRNATIGDTNTQMYGRNKTAETDE